MATSGGPDIERNGLVFGYDTGYGVATNSNATRHYSGFPVTNMLSYGAAFNSWTKARNSGSYPTVDVKVAKGPFPGTLADRLSLPSDGSYPRIYQNFTPSSTATHTFSIWLKGETEGQGCFIGAFRNSPWNGASSTTFSITTEWVNYSFNISPLDTSSHQLYIGSHNSHGGKVFLMYGALLQTGGTKTVFTDGTRSSTQSLIDLTKTTNVDVSNVSFDSTGQPTFDGTDDRIDSVTGVGITDYSQPFTMECVFMVPTGATWANSFMSNIFSIAGGYSGHYGFFKAGSDTVGFQIRDASTGSYPQAGGFARDVWHHVIAVWQGGSGLTFYKNGEFAASHSTGKTGAPDSTSLYIGGLRAFSGNNGSWFQGDIPVAKYYNRALSADEVQQNYNAYKNRFNL